MDICVNNIGGVWFGVACEMQKVVATCFGGDEKEILKNLQQIAQFKGPLQTPLKPSTFAEKTLSLMRSIYEGKHTSEDVPLSMEQLPAYTQRILRTVSRIPIGYVSSYGGVAKAAGGGARAVGNAMACNPFAPLVPCHRVVTSDLGLGGYSGNLRVKLELLERERQGFTEAQEILVEGGGVLRVFPVEAVLKKFETSTKRKGH